MPTWLRGICLGVAVIMATSAAAAEKRIALIVANATYAGAALANPLVDADLVARSLEGSGFEVETVRDADLGRFDKAVQDFAARAQGADVALFYFAGHGFAVNESLKPVSLLMATSADITSTSERVLRAGGIPLDDIVQSLGGKARSTLVFVDACRNDPRVSRSGGGMGRGLSRLEPVRGGNLMIGLSTRLGDVAADGIAGQGSPFARAFATNIAAPGLRIDDAFRKVRDAVRVETDGRQVPDIIQDDLPEGAIVLGRLDSPVPLVAPPPRVDGASRLAEAAQVWNALQDSKDVATLEAFVKRYEGTFFADMAQLRLRTLGEAGKQAALIVPLPPPVPSAGAPVDACDNLAADPKDPDKVTEGVLGSKLSLISATAACSDAVARFPNERRFAFQYARVLDIAGRYGEAAPLYSKAADGGSLIAMNSLGDLYKNGKGVARDPARAAELYRRSAESGNAYAIHEMGLIYEFGRSVPIDMDEAVRWYRRGAEKGNSYSYTALGNLSRTGKSVPLDFAEARRLYLHAVSLGNDIGMVELGQLYEKGRGVEVDGGEAVRLYRQAANQGNVTAMALLGYAFARGLPGVAKDTAEAARWYRKAADRGHVIATSNLGALYRTGNGVPRDMAEAVKLFTRAAEKGNVVAMRSLAEIYERGGDIPRNPAQARRWRDAAAAAPKP